MPHTKTPGGQQASEKFVAREEQAAGAGAKDAPGRSEEDVLNPPVKDDAPTSNIGITEITKHSAGTDGAVNAAGAEGGDDRVAGAPSKALEE